MLRLTIDTNVMASAFRSRSGASFGVIGLVRRKMVRMLATPPLFLEYEAVLKRPEQLAVSGLSLTDIDTALDALAALIEPVEAHLSWRPQLDDPDDEMVLETAINGRADALVTYNDAHFRIAAARFGVRLARPAEILREAITP
ncbi:MAG TPA: putative toxin-antitoxin system toxin component, PIN family [Acetobacteraceae bacterium]|jgi:putative PIN family toxin of toxin-antitoxin system|nr:putative toxin-antitoxin system toxin component, PIN family [Acetobacteraceae bacterium]